MTSFSLCHSHFFPPLLLLTERIGPTGQAKALSAIPQATLLLPPLIIWRAHTPGFSVMRNVRGLWISIDLGACVGDSPTFYKSVGSETQHHPHQLKPY